MNTIFQAYINALLADATYALGKAEQGDLTGATANRLTGYLTERMTPTLAKYLGDNFTVVTHIETGDVFGSGFDATVWKENTTGKLTVSMQGTTGLQDFLTDVDLAVSGNAPNQIVNMINWWFQITTPTGESARQFDLETLYDNSIPPVAVGSQAHVTHTSTFTRAEGQTSVTGQGTDQSATKLEAIYAYSTRAGGPFDYKQSAHNDTIWRMTA